MSSPKLLFLKKKKKKTTFPFFLRGKNGEDQKIQTKNEKGKFREIKQNRKSSEEPLSVNGRGKRRHRSETRPTRFLPQNWKRKYRRVRGGKQTRWRRPLPPGARKEVLGRLRAGLAFLQDAQRKALEPPRSGPSPSALPASTRPQGRLPHLHQPAAPGDKVDGELVLPPHHARRLRAAAAAATATSSSPGWPRASAPSPWARLPSSGPGPRSPLPASAAKAAPVDWPRSADAPQKGAGAFSTLPARSPTLKGIRRTKALARRREPKFWIWEGSFCALFFPLCLCSGLGKDRTESPGFSSFQTAQRVTMNWACNP